ncbi:hypothetical protein GFS31_18100 [Leptolyngbya sp. BL0902]|nr:hypothetical protein GFS31_18100 [Leptolyngbya sp. BL0902]
MSHASQPYPLILSPRPDELERFKVLIQFSPGVATQLQQFVKPPR